MKNKFILSILLTLMSFSLLASNSSYTKHVYSKIRKKVPIFQKCYSKALDQKGHIKGKTVTFILAIDNTGFLEGIHVEDSFDMSVLRCINRNVAGMIFTKPPNGKEVRIRMPLKFKLNYY